MVNNTVEKVYIQCVQMRQDKGGKAIAIKHWNVQQLNTGMLNVQKMNVQVEILGCKGAKTKNIGMRQFGGLFTDGLCTDAMIGKLL